VPENLTGGSGKFRDENWRQGKGGVGAKGKKEKVGKDARRGGGGG